jgi:thiol-disulfide isomerase/thioredoxin
MNNGKIIAYSGLCYLKLHRMRKIFSYLCFSFALFLSVSIPVQAADKDKGYQIKVKITGIGDSMLLLANYYADKQYLRDSAFLDKQGFYVFKGKTKLEPGMYTIAGQSKVKYFDFIVDDVQNMSLETDTTEFSDRMKVTNSPENVVFFDYLRYMNRKLDERNAIEDRYKQAKEHKSDSADIYKKQVYSLDSGVHKYKKDFIAANSKAFFPKMLLSMQEIEIPEAPKVGNGIDSSFAYRYYKAHYWDNVDLSDDRMLRTPLFYERLKKFFDHVVVQQPDSVFAESVKMIDRTKGNKEMFKYLVYYITNRAETSDIMGMDAAFVYMVDKYYRTGQAYWVDSTTLFRINDRADKLKKVLIGQFAPPLNCVDSTLSKFIPLYSVKAKYTVVVFWDPGCGHCQKEMPKLVESYDKMLKEGMDVKVYSVCATSTVEEWKKYIREKGHTKFINVIDHDISRRNYDVNTTPVFYVLDENKKIIAKRLVSDQIADFLKRFSTMKKGQTLTVQLKEEEKEH